MRRQHLLLGAGVLALGTAAALVPQLLRRVDFFRVRQVELAGLRYSAPEQVLATLQLEPERNVFDPLGDVERRAASVPGVSTVRIARRLPGTLHVVFVEEDPIAFARGQEGLVPLGVDARPLPYDPSLTGFDLPIVEQADSQLTQLLALVRNTDTTLFQLVDGARRGPGDAIILELGAQRVLFRAAPLRSRIRDVQTVRWHLLRNRISFHELDARFDGGVVVRGGDA
jgi:cell division septal protein FtsQ